VLDFGIAKMMNSGQKLTAVGSVIGTPHYMSPEQATGSRTDERTDIYSLGVILYEMACGKVPFDAESPLAVISMQVTDQPPPLSKRMPEGRTMPKGYEAVVMKCLAKDPNERFTSMNDVRAALERIAAGGVPLVMPPKTADGVPEETDSVIHDLKKDTDYQVLHRAARRRTGGLRLTVVAVLGVVGYLGWRYVGPLLPKPALPSIVIVPANQAEPTPPPVAPPPPAPVPPPAPAVVVPEVHKVALIMFPLDARAFDGDKELGMMPVTLELTPGQSKTIEVRRKTYVTRTVRLDGTKSRVVIGLVSNAVAAKRKGLTQAEQEALADRAAEVQAEKVVLEESEEGGSIPEVTDGETVPAAKSKKAKGTPAEADEPAKP
jgi:eukaryotic-like serine/threonine-protein kinase